MKGFPNQIAELPKIALGIRCMADLVAAGDDAKNDGVFGEALVRAGVAGTGHTPRPVEEYLAEQRRKTLANQSFRATARGLRELYRLMGFIDDSGEEITTTELGERAASFAGQPWGQKQIEFWRGVIRNIEHTNNEGTSHPYQVMLRLVARKPGITRAKCALALEAADDSAGELDRIVSLSGQDEAKIIADIGVSESNWDNAKKVLPRFAEQLGDVIRGKGGSYVLADAPGQAGARGAAAAVAPRTGRERPSAPRAPRSSREVTPETIGMAGIAEKSDEVPLPPPGDPAAIAAAIKLRGNRLRRHNLMVRAFSALFAQAGSALYEDPFDILALFKETGILVEVKTLDGTAPDERERVRDAFGQLLYYEGFLTAAVSGDAPIFKVACFETKISDAHRDWLNGHQVATAWGVGNSFAGDALAHKFLGPYLKEFR